MTNYITGESHLKCILDTYYDSTLNKNAKTQYYLTVNGLLQEPGKKVYYIHDKGKTQTHINGIATMRE